MSTTHVIAASQSIAVLVPKGLCEVRTLRHLSPAGISALFIIGKGQEASAAAKKAARALWEACSRQAGRSRRKGKNVLCSFRSMLYCFIMLPLMLLLLVLLLQTLYKQQRFGYKGFFSLYIKYALCEALTTTMRMSQRNF